MKLLNQAKWKKLVEKITHQKKNRGHWASKIIKDDFQSVLLTLGTLMFINIINVSLDGMQIDVIR